MAVDGIRVLVHGINSGHTVGVVALAVVESLGAGHVLVRAGDRVHASLSIITVVSRNGSIAGSSGDSHGRSSINKLKGRVDTARGNVHGSGATHGSSEVVLE